MDALINDMRSDISSMLASEIKGMEDKVLGRTSQLLKAYDGQVQAQFGEQSERIAEVAARQAAAAVVTRDLIAQVKSLSDALAISDQPASAPIVDLEWDRRPDTTIVRVSSKDDVPMQSIIDSVKVLTDRVAIAIKDYKIFGRPVGKYYTIQMGGDPQTAARRAQKLISSLRNPDGAWTEVFTTTPSGGNSQLFIGADRSKAQMALAASTKRLAAVVETEYNALRISSSPKDGIVFINGKPAVKVAVPSATEVEFQWHGSVLADARVDRAILKQKYELVDSTRRVDRVLWEV